MKKFIHVTLILTVLPILLTGCGDPGTRVQIAFQSSQVNADYAGEARYAVAVPQSKMIKIYLFSNPLAGCDSTLRDLAVAELYVPTAPSTLPGIKFAPPFRPDWATSTPMDEELIKDLKITETTVSGCIDRKIRLEETGNSGSIKGCFRAKICPARPLDLIGAERGSSSVDISMSLPGSKSNRHVGNSIAFIARDRVMVFFQDTNRLTCENYRLVAKQGLFEFRYESGQTSFGPGDAVKLAPVDPEKGWSFHFGPDLMQVTEARASISPDGKYISGNLDISTRGVDPLSLKEFFHNGISPEDAEKVSCSLSGTFKAPICPEF